MLTACGVNLGPVRIGPAPATTPTVARPVSGQTTRPAQADIAPTKAVQFFAYRPEGGNRALAGQVVTLVIVAKPVIYSAQGTGTSMKNWEGHTVAHMQYCVSPDTPCKLQGAQGAWEPFTSTRASASDSSQVELEAQVKVDWIGARTLWVMAQFRDAQGNIVPAVSGSERGAVAVAQYSLLIEGTLDPAIPLTAQPSAIRTAVAATSTAYPVTGSVVIEDGRCCIGGAAGDTVTVHVSFAAHSPNGEVREMRVSTMMACTREGDMSAVSWEPFAAARTYPIKLAINWTGFYVSAQFRDAQGNLSPVYCRDISVEGNPPAAP